ncbi:MAG: tetraacyldisaccharide 4'-kinase [Sedimentisphaerales bacterium]|nr:tetraacyldisaccharide 4'-kinase [Sedimentisphaerales bacterium]
MWARSIISGKSRGTGAIALRILLAQASLIYSAVIRVRNRLYDEGSLKKKSLKAPVICVGNITAGGTGKTPMVMWLCRYLLGKGKKVVLLNRGYKSRKGPDNDETRMIREALPEVPIIIDSDRVRGGQRAMEEYNPDVILLDDGFQHRRLARDLDIVMIDCTCPFGYGWLLPRGLLREPLKELKRAGAIVFSRCDCVRPEVLSTLKQQVINLTRPDIPILYTCHEPVRLYDKAGNRVPLSDLRKRKILAFCGVGNPESFVKNLEKLGAEVTGRHFFSDHVCYSKKVGKNLEKKRQNCGADWLVTTQKDWVKLKGIKSVRQMEEVYWLRVDIALLDSDEQFCAAIDSVCRKS